MVMKCNVFLMLYNATSNSNETVCVFQFWMTFVLFFVNVNPNFKTITQRLLQFKIFCILSLHSKCEKEDERGGGYKV